MIYGYARVSTRDQNLDRQEDFFAGKADKVFEEKISGRNRNRPQLAAMLAALKPGDVVLVSELSRLGRSVKDLIDIVEEIRSKGAIFKSYKENIDLSTASGELIFHIMASLAEFERKQMLDRQAEGIASARARGKTVGGSKPRFTMPEDEAEALFTSYRKREISFSTAAEAWGSVGSFQYNYKRWLAAKEAAEAEGKEKA